MEPCLSVSPGKKQLILHCNKWYCCIPPAVAYIAPAPAWLADPRAYACIYLIHTWGALPRGRREDHEQFVRPNLRSEREIRPAEITFSRSFVGTERLLYPALLHITVPLTRPQDEALVEAVRYEARGERGLHAYRSFVAEPIDGDAPMLGCAVHVPSCGT